MTLNLTNHSASQTGLPPATSAFPNVAEAPSPEHLAVRLAPSSTQATSIQDPSATSAARLKRGMEAGKRKERARYLSVSMMVGWSKEYHLGRLEPLKYHSRAEIEQIISSETSGRGTLAVEASLAPMDVPGGTALATTERSAFDPSGASSPASPCSSNQISPAARSAPHDAIDGLSAAVGAKIAADMPRGHCEAAAAPLGQIEPTSGSASNEATSGLAAAISARIAADRLGGHRVTAPASLKSPGLASGSDATDGLAAAISAQIAADRLGGHRMAALRPAKPSRPLAGGNPDDAADGLAAAVAERIGVGRR